MSDSLQDLIYDIKIVSKNLANLSHDELKGCMLKGKEVAEQSTPVDSGDLKANWKYTESKKGNDLRMEVYNDSIYAVAQELGGVTPTGGVYLGHGMTEKGAKEVEQQLNKAGEEILDKIEGKLIR